jgi:hypothetical protein
LVDIVLSPTESQWLDPHRDALLAALRSISGQTSPREVAELAWNAVFSKCKRQDLSAPSFFEASRYYDPTKYNYPRSDLRGQTRWVLQEFLGTLVYPDPKGEPLSDTDVLNKVQWRGSTFLRVSSARMLRSYFDKNGQRLGASAVYTDELANSWPEFEDWSRTPKSWPTIHLEKKNNQWSFSGYWSAPNEPVQFKLSCSTATAADPFLGTFDQPPVQAPTVARRAAPAKETQLFACPGMVLYSRGASRSVDTPMKIRRAVMKDPDGTVTSIQLEDGGVYVITKGQPQESCPTK